MARKKYTKKLIHVFNYNANQIINLKFAIKSKLYNTLIKLINNKKDIKISLESSTTSIFINDSFDSYMSIEVDKKSFYNNEGYLNEVPIISFKDKAHDNNEIVKIYINDKNSFNKFLQSILKISNFDFDKKDFIDEVVNLNIEQPVESDLVDMSTDTRPFNPFELLMNSQPIANTTDEDLTDYEREAIYDESGIKGNKILNNESEYNEDEEDIPEMSPESMNDN